MWAHARVRSEGQESFFKTDCRNPESRTELLKFCEHWIACRFSQGNALHLSKTGRYICANFARIICENPEKSGYSDFQEHFLRIEHLKNQQVIENHFYL